MAPLDYPERIKRRLGASLAGWKAMLAETEKNYPGNSPRIKAVQEIVKVYVHEFVHFGGEVR